MKVSVRDSAFRTGPGSGHLAAQDLGRAAFIFCFYFFIGRAAFKEKARHNFKYPKVSISVVLKWNTSWWITVRGACTFRRGKSSSQPPLASLCKLQPLFNLSCVGVKTVGVSTRFPPSFSLYWAPRHRRSSTVSIPKYLSTLFFLLQVGLPCFKHSSFVAFNDCCNLQTVVPLLATSPAVPLEFPC